MTTIDVNRAFADERASQIAWAEGAADRAREARATREADFDQRVKDGKLRNLGNGRFQVTDPDSWDDGEILTMQTSIVNGQEERLILPEHGLDTTTGEAALYTRVPAWHSLGVVIPEGTNDIDRVLRLARLNWQVETLPVTYHAAGKDRTVPGKYVTVRNDTYEPLGVVGNQYVPIQNDESFTFLQDLIERYSLPFESAGALGNGSKVFVSLRLPQDVVIDPEGINDTITPFIAAINTHDGSGKEKVVLTPWRIQCGNTERFAVRDAVVSWGVRHTANAHSAQSVKDAQRTFANAVKYFEQFTAEETLLAQAKFEIDAFRALVDHVWDDLKPDSDASERTKNAWTKRTDGLVDVYRSNTDTLGRTAYAAERAVTEWLDNHKTVRPGSSLKGDNRTLVARATAVMNGADDERKSKTHRQLMTLVRR